MENTSLHAQKVTILSRLIKESSLTLEEALLLLKEEEVEELVINTPSPTTSPWTIPNTNIPWQPYTGTLSGSGITTGTGVTWTVTNGSTTSSFTVPNREVETDLNN